MDFHLWLAFVGASIALLAIPGPVVMLLLGYVLGYGRGAAAAAVPGVILGDFTAMTLSLLGAGAVLSASATLFTALKIAGAAYLVWLGIRLWRREADPLTAGKPTAGHSRKRAFRDAFVVTALNLALSLAIEDDINVLLIDADVPRPILPQIVVIEATFLGLVLVCNVTWILLGSSLSRALRTPRHLRTANRVGAGWLVGAGALTAFSR